jgi:hypothetical protein
MNYEMSSLTLYELQSMGISGDKDAILELGKKMLSIDICEIGCTHKYELQQLKEAIETDYPEYCPECDTLLTDLL